MKKKYTALVLQGGGALGAYEYGVVKALYEQEGFAPDIIAGVSIGAISAAVLAGAKDGPVRGLGQLWDRLTVPDLPFVPDQLQLMMSLPNNSGMYKLNQNLFFSPQSVTSLCDTTPLYDTLKTLVDLDQLNAHSTPQVIVTATNIATGMIESFSNKEVELTSDHIVASGSLPPSFPMTQIDNQHYWDGGVYSNTPLAPAFNALEMLGDEDSEREIIMIELFPQQGEIPTTMGDVYNRMSQLSFESKIRYDANQYSTLNDYIDLMHAIDKELPEGSQIRQNNAYQKLMSYKKIHRLTVIRHTEPELLTGGADFTQKSISRRIEQGYRDAKQQLVL